jgi:hypothetical protein
VVILKHDIISAAVITINQLDDIEVPTLYYDMDGLIAGNMDSYESTNVRRMIHPFRRSVVYG